MLVTSRWQSIGHPASKETHMCTVTCIPTSADCDDASPCNVCPSNHQCNAAVLAYAQQTPPAQRFSLRWQHSRRFGFLQRHAVAVSVLHHSASNTHHLTLDSDASVCSHVVAGVTPWYVIQLLRATLPETPEIMTQASVLQASKCPASSIFGHSLVPCALTVLLQSKYDLLC
jgi:hypothetical protein